MILTSWNYETLFLGVARNEEKLMKRSNGITEESAAALSTAR